MQSQIVNVLVIPVKQTTYIINMIGIIDIEKITKKLLDFRTRGHHNHSGYDQVSH